MSEATPPALGFDAWRGKEARKLAQYLEQGARASTDRHLVSAAIRAAACAGDQDLVAELMHRLFPDARCIAPMRVLPRARLQTWCAASGVALRTPEAAREVVLEARTAFTLPYRYQCEPTAFASLPQASWVPGWDYVISADDIVLEDTSYLGFDMMHSVRPHLPAGNSAAVCYVPNTIVDIAEDCLFVSGPTVPNIGHWMIDFLPRLRGFASIGKPCRIAIEATAPRKYLELLRSFGVQDADVIRCDDQHRYRFETLHYYRPGRSMPPNPAQVEFVRARIARPAEKPKRGKRIFLERGSVGTRQVANAAEFSGLLDELGFTRFDLADLSIAQQRETLADAELLLGADGSHLLGLYFAPEGCTVMALMDEPKNDMLIGPTCAFLGMEYQFVRCDRAPAPSLQRLRKDQDIIVDCAALKERILAVS